MDRGGFPGAFGSKFDDLRAGERMAFLPHQLHDLILGFGEPEIARMFGVHDIDLPV